MLYRSLAGDFWTGRAAEGGDICIYIYICSLRAHRGVALGRSKVGEGEKERDDVLSTNINTNKNVNINSTIIIIMIIITIITII